MKTNGSQYLLMYDITHAGTLHKVARILERYGFERINYSVWLGHEDPGKSVELNRKIRFLLSNPKAENSRFYYIRVSVAALQKMKTHTGRRPDELDFWLGVRKTQFL